MILDYNINFPHNFPVVLSDTSRKILISSHDMIHYSMIRVLCPPPTRPVFWKWYKKQGLLKGFPDDIFQLHYIIYKINIAYIQKIQIMEDKTIYYYYYYKYHTHLL